jgi:hypothetical protein
MEGTPAPSMPHPVSSRRSDHPAEGVDQFRCKGMIRPRVLAGDQLAVLDDMGGEVDRIRGDVAARHAQCIGHVEIELAVKDLFFDRFLLTGREHVIL